MSTGVYIKFDESVSIKIIYKTVFLPPTIFADDLKIETFAEDLSMPTTMSFIGNDLLVLEKEGNVKLIRDGNIQSESILTLDVISGGEGNDWVAAGDGNDRILGGDGIDNLFGEAGNDIIDGGAGADTCDGGTGTNAISNC